VDLSRGWGLNTEDRALIALLSKTLEAGDGEQRHDFPSGASYPGSDPVETQLNALADRGWLTLGGDYDGINYQLSSAGADTARAIRDRRDNAIRRRVDARDAVLYFVSGHGPRATVDELLASDNSWYFDRQLTVAEIEESANFLEAEGWISTQGSWQGLMWMDPLPKGDRLVETGKSVNDPQPKGGIHYDQSTNITTGGGPAYTQAHTHSSTMNVTINPADRQLALEFAQRLEDVLPQLGLSDEAAATLPPEIREATEIDNPRFLRRVLESVVTQLATSTATALSGPLSQDALRIVHQLASLT
jgi:hypothetical protein